MRRKKEFTKNGGTQSLLRGEGKETFRRVNLKKTRTHRNVRQKKDSTTRGRRGVMSYF